MKKTGLIISVFFLLAIVRAEAPAWIWYPEKPQDNSYRAFRKTFRIDSPVKSAQLLILADDGAEVRINNSPEKPLPGWLKFNRYDVTGQVRQGENVISIRARNGRADAGLLCRFEVFTEKGIVEINTGTDWKCSTEFPEKWQDAEFDDSAWKNAGRIGNANISPWNRLVDVTPFLAGTATRGTAISVLKEKQGRLMLDDFSDLSSWMGWPLKGMRPGHNVLPYQLGFGAGPDSARDDGGTGMIDYEFIQPGGLIVFEKNAVYKNPAVAEAIEFDANPQGYECEIYFELMDRSDKAMFKTLPVRISGDEWKRYRLELNEKTVENFDSFVFPVSIRRLCFAGGKPGKGRVLLDDLCCIVDLSGGNGAITIHPEYHGLAHGLNQPVRQEYRIRNNWNRPVDNTVAIEVFDIADRKLFSAKKKVKIDAFGLGRVAFDVGAFAKKGSYRTEVTVENPVARQVFTGWFGVFEPNNRRLNNKPMWFGVEDQGLRNFRYEEELHVGWMKMLGVDIIRGNAIGNQLEWVPFTDFGYEQYQKMYQPHFDAGINLVFSYAGDVPGWVGKPIGAKRDVFEKHMLRIAEFMNRNPGIRYFEWFNEPNLGYFRERTTEEYLDTQRIFYPIFKKYAPNVKVATGGVVINHARARKDFAKRMFQENADFYDVACYHGHEGYAAHLSSLATLDGWLAEAKLKKPFGNSEAGARSYYTHPDMFRLQAAELVKKISLTKSRNSEFYIWFMLHDYGDKYINADDSFGLVTVDNQPKPSFLAYNELIRQLADTDPAEPLTLDSRLMNYRFSNDAEDVFVCWSHGGGFSFALRSDSPVRKIDIFGNETLLRPAGGIVFVESGVMPFYLRSPKGALAAVESPLRVIGNAVFVPGEKSEMELELVNPYRETFLYTLQAEGVERKGRLRSGAVQRIKLPVGIPADAEFGSKPLRCKLTLNSEKGTLLLDDEISIDCNIALPVGGKPGAVIRLDRADQVREMMFDPNSPRWSGPEDLSAEIRLSRRGTTLIFDAVVIDDDHSVPGEDAYVWKNDCIQVGIANMAGDHYEFTASESGAGKAVVWNHIRPGEAGFIGSAWDVPVTVTRQKNRTVYHFEIPAEKVGLHGRAGELFRIAYLVNDTDKGRHMRFMEWGSGIQPSKNTNLFGWGKLVK